MPRLGHARVGGRRNCGTLATDEALYVRKSGSPHDRYLSIHIDNYTQIVQVFGSQHAEKFANAVCSALYTLPRDERFDCIAIRPGEDGWLDAVFASDDKDCFLLAHAYCVIAASTPILIGTTAVVPVLSFHERRPDAAMAELPFDSAVPTVGRVAFGASSAPLASAPDNHDCYNRDMALTVALMEAIRDDGLLLAWQPIRHTYDPSHILYRHALPNLIDKRGLPEPANDHLLAAQRIGAAPVIDCYLVSRAIDELQASPTVSLGVKISGRSSKLNFWWTEVIARLSADRSLGPRLFLEIGGDEPFPPLCEVTAFVDRMRSLGCNVIIGNFGSGFSSIRAIMALKPDFVKIDPLFLRHAGQSEKGRKLFDHLAGLAGEIAGTVIVDGVETAQASSIPRDAGILWQQGHYQGAPSLSRVWISDLRDEQITALEKFRDSFVQNKFGAQAENGVA